MSDKIVITADQVVARANGYVSFVDDGGSLRKARAELIEVREEGADTAALTPQTPPPPVPEPPAPAKAAEPVATPDPEPASNPKPKAAKKPQKERQVATPATAKAKTPVKPTPKAAPKAKTAPAAKKAANKPAAANKAPTPSGVRTIGGKVVDISRYEKSKAPGGGTSYNNGDVVAQLLDGKSLDECYGIASKKLKVDEKELRKQYSHLNVGMQRMTLGNRVRKVMIPKEAK